MIALASELIQAFPRLRVAVVGEAMLDCYLNGVSGRLCQEAPVPIVDIARRRYLPGGAANSALNIRTLGGRPILLSVVGDDAEAGILRQCLAEQRITTRYLVTHPLRQTLAKNRIMAGSHMVVRFDHGNTEPIDEEAEQQLIEHLEKVIPDCDLVLVSDYSYGILTPRVIDCLARLQADRPRPIVVDSKDLAAYRELAPLAVKPNYREAMQLLGTPEFASGSRRWEDLAGRGERILELTGARIAAVTLDSEGALLFERGGKPYRTYARPAPQYHAAGAGDTYLATLALALAAGAAAPVAAELAAAAAAVVVAKEFTATCSTTELLQHISGDWRPRSDLAYLLPLIEAHRAKGRRIVLTNGCFDLLHRGHITYLHQAKALGDVLVVGLNSDASIGRLKGPNRPINSAQDRLEVLASLSCVDHVVVFEEDTPHQLIEAIRPDVFVKGGDYTRETLPEASLVEQFGGTVKILPFVQDRSTSGIIQRICEVYGPKETAAAPAAARFHGVRDGGNGNGHSNGNGNGHGKLERRAKRLVR